MLNIAVAEASTPAADEPTLNGGDQSVVSSHELSRLEEGQLAADQQQYGPLNRDEATTAEALGTAAIPLPSSSGQGQLMIMDKPSNNMEKGTSTGGGTIRPLLQPAQTFGHFHGLQRAKVGDFGAQRTDFLGLDTAENPVKQVSSSLFNEQQSKATIMTDQPSQQRIQREEEDKSMYEKTKEAITDTAQEAKEKLAAAKDTVVDTTYSAKDEVADTLGSAQGRTAESYESAKEQAQNAIGRKSHEAGEKYDVTKQSIADSRYNDTSSEVVKAANGLQYQSLREEQNLLSEINIGESALNVQFWLAVADIHELAQNIQTMQKEVAQWQNVHSKQVEPVLERFADALRLLNGPLTERSAEVEVQLTKQKSASFLHVEWEKARQLLRGTQAQIGTLREQIEANLTQSSKLPLKLVDYDSSESSEDETQEALKPTSVAKSKPKAPSPSDDSSDSEDEAPKKKVVNVKPTSVVAKRKEPSSKRTKTKPKKHSSSDDSINEQALRRSTRTIMPPINFTYNIFKTPKLQVPRKLKTTKHQTPKDLVPSEFIIEGINGRRGRKSKREYLIKWKELDNSWSSWESKFRLLRSKEDEEMMEEFDRNLETEERRQYDYIPTSVAKSKSDCSSEDEMPKKKVLKPNPVVKSADESVEDEVPKKKVLKPAPVAKSADDSVEDEAPKKKVVKPNSVAKSKTKEPSSSDDSFEDEARKKKVVKKKLLKSTPVAKSKPKEPLSADVSVEDEAPKKKVVKPKSVAKPKTKEPLSADDSVEDEAPKTKVVKPNSVAKSKTKEPSSDDSSEDEARKEVLKPTSAQVKVPSNQVKSKPKEPLSSDDSSEDEAPKKIVMNGIEQLRAGRKRNGARRRQEKKLEKKLKKLQSK